MLIEFLAVLDLDDALFFHSAEDLDSHHFLFRVQHVFLTVSLTESYVSVCLIFSLYLMKRF